MSPRNGPCSLDAALVALDHARAARSLEDEEPEPDTLRDGALFAEVFAPAPNTIRSGEAPPTSTSEALEDEIARLFADLSPSRDAGRYDGDADPFADDGADLGSSQVRVRALAPPLALATSEAMTPPPPARRAGLRFGG